MARKPIRKARIRPDKNKPKRPRGHPPHEPDEKSREQVAVLAVAGTPQPLIARVIGVAPKTLTKHYREELDLAVIRANAAVASNMYRRAVGKGPDAVTAGRFWLTHRAGWKEQPREISGPGGGPVPMQIVVAKDDFSL